VLHLSILDDFFVFLPLLVTRGSFPTVEIQFRLHNEPIIPNILVPGLERSSAIPLTMGYTK
jgi:hypothetical protein